MMLRGFFVWGVLFSACACEYYGYTGAYMPYLKFVSLNGVRRKMHAACLSQGEGKPALCTQFGNVWMAWQMSVPYS